MCTWRCRVAGRVERVLSCGGASVFVGGWPCVAARKSVGDLILLVSSGCHAGPSTPCLCTNSGVRRTCTRGCGNPSTHAPSTYVYTHNHMRTDRAHLPIQYMHRPSCSYRRPDLAARAKRFASIRSWSRLACFWRFRTSLRWRACSFLRCFMAYSS